MKTLLIMRHAKSSWDDAQMKDHDRPLNERGKKAAPVMGELLKKQKAIPEIIICSTARRTIETMDLLIKTSGFNGTVLRTDDLYEATANDYLDVINDIDNAFQSAMVIGHNPTCEELFYLLTGQRESFSTATIAYLKLPVSNWKQLKPVSKNTVLHLWHPKEL